MFVGRVRSSSLGPEPVEDGHAERADEVAVGAAGDRRLVQVEAELAAVLARAGEQLRGAGRPLERRARPAAREADRRARRLRLEPAEERVDAVALGERRDAYVEPRAG